MRQEDCPHCNECTHLAALTAERDALAAEVADIRKERLEYHAVNAKLAARVAEYEAHWVREDQDQAALRAKLARAVEALKATQSVPCFDVRDIVTAALASLTEGDDRG